MMVYSFVIGLTALLTGLDSVVLHDAVNKISGMYNILPRSR